MNTIRGAYWRRLLRVDLTDHSVGSSGIAESVLSQWIGGTGLGTYLLSQESADEMSALDARSPMYLLTGPLTGTLAPNASEWSIASLHPQLRSHMGVSHGHGYFGARLKRAGWDGIVVTGAASRPTYLLIDDDRVEIRDASPYWGKTTAATAADLASDLGDDFSVACIGPAGENRLPGSIVRADGTHCAVRGSPGLVWGSKNLKAIAVRGARDVPLASPGAFEDLCEEWRQLLRTGRDFQALGIRTAADRALTWGYVMAKNFGDTDLQVEWGHRLNEDVPRWRITALSSWMCDLACHADTLVTTGPMAGARIRGFGSEIMESFGPNLGILDPGTALALGGYLDDLGLDSGEIGHNIAMCMEAYERGRLTSDELDGIELQWGAYDAVVELVEKTVRRSGVGALLALDTRECAERLGIADLAVHMKGVGFNDLDQRAFQTRLFQSMISTAGPAWQADNPEMFAEPDLGYPELMSATDVSGKGRAAYLAHCKKQWEDTTGVCLFACRGRAGVLGLSSRVLAAAVGWEPLSDEQTLLVGRRIITLQRLLALRRGYDPSEDFDMSSRLFGRLGSGPAKGHGLTRAEFARMRDEYYECLQWDPQTGVPRREALEAVGLAHL